MAYPVPDPYNDAIRSGVTLSYTADAYLGGSPVVGAQGLRPTPGGSVTDTTKPGVRRNVSMDLPPAPGLFDLLAPVGTTLNVTAHVRFTDRTTTDIPMGVFSIDDQSMEEGGGKLSVTALDRWSLIQRAKFITPGVTTPGIRVVDQIASLIRGAVGIGEPVVITSTSTAMTSALTFDSDDRAAAIITLADGIGAWVYCDRLGVFTIADVPTLGPSADWLIDASPSGVLHGLTRSRSRANTFNVVALESSAASSTPAFPIQYVWDSDTRSPTYAGPDPINHPELAGPFGVSVYHTSNPLPLTTAAANKTAHTILSKTVGLASQVSLSTPPNPAADAFDALDVMPPKERYDIPRVIERHVADTLTHPLDVSAPLQVDGRSTRTDPYS